MGVDFTNEPLDLSGVPRLDPTAFHPLDPAHGRLLVLGHVAVGVVVVIATALVATRLGVLGGLIGIGVLALVVVSAIVVNAEVRHMGWLVRDHDLSYRHGLLTRSIDTLPFARIQHARIERGPLQRTLGIATLQVSSAGPDVRIAGLSADDAERLKAIVIERSGATDDNDDSNEGAPPEAPAPIAPPVPTAPPAPTQPPAPTAPPAPTDPHAPSGSLEGPTEDRPDG